MIEETLVLFQNIRNPSYDKSLKGYKKAGGFKALKNALKMSIFDSISYENAMKNENAFP